MTRRNVMMSVTPWPTRINANADDPEHSRMEPGGTLAYMLAIEGGTATGVQTISVREGVTTITIGPLDADQLRKLGRTLVRKADERDRLLARLEDSDDVLGLRARTVSLCEMAIRS